MAFIYQKGTRMTFRRFSIKNPVVRNGLWPSQGHLYRAAHVISSV